MERVAKSAAAKGAMFGNVTGQVDRMIGDQMRNVQRGLLCVLLLALWMVGPARAALVTGDVAFVGFNADGADGFAFVALNSIDANSTIFFRDDELNSGAFNTGESVITWQSGATVIAAGSVVRVSNLASGVIATDLGSSALSGVGGFGTANEGLFAYTGVDANTPGTFLSAIFNGTVAGSGSSLTGTGLTIGTNAIEFGNNHDVFEYTGPRNTQSTFSGYQSLVNNPSNWLSEDGAGDQSNNGTAPDVPFNNTAFSTTTAAPEPSALLLSLSSGLALLAWWWHTQRQAASVTQGI